MYLGVTNEGMPYMAGSVTICRTSCVQTSSGENRLVSRINTILKNQNCLRLFLKPDIYHATCILAYRCYYAIGLYMYM